jgi:broad specificity phosphatase PhoE
MGLCADQGRSPQDITTRLDRLIEEIRSKYHSPVIGKPKSHDCTGDVLVAGHGHILRAFAIRWIGKGLEEASFLMEAGGVGTLR